VARRAATWGPGRTVGLVVGATAPQELAVIRALVPGLAFLVPGVGAQGGELAPVLAEGPATALVADRGAAGPSAGPSAAPVLPVVDAGTLAAGAVRPAGGSTAGGLRLLRPGEAPLRRGADVLLWGSDEAGGALPGIPIAPDANRAASFGTIR